MSSKVTVNELYDRLSDLIAEGYEDKYVELSVRYDNCEHIQILGEVYVNDDLDWILLRGAKE